MTARLGERLMLPPQSRRPRGPGQGPHHWGYLGARLQPHLPERTLRIGLGVLAIAAASFYAAQALR